MNYSEAIGGYFEAEPSTERGHNLHEQSLLLNTARNCFEYILRANTVRHVYMPAYTCSVMFEPLDKLGISYSTYEIDKALEIARLPNLESDEMIVYTNYFGLKDAYCDDLVDLLADKLILDCSQALYYRPKASCHVLYSPRKFVGLADGGCLYTPNLLDEKTFPVDVDSMKRTSHLILRREQGAEAGYADFIKNDASLSGQPIMRMSEMTQNMMSGIDFEAVKERRKENFAYLFDRLGARLYVGRNNWKDMACPMIFPLHTDNSRLRQELIDKRIYTATYWPNILNDMPQGTVEYEVASTVVALTVDQRYNENDMQRVVEAVYECDNTTAAG